MSDVCIDYVAPPTIGLFLGSDAQARLIVGPVGSGKSSGCCIEILRRAQETPKGIDGLRHSRCVVIRNSYRELRDTTRKTFEQWVPPVLGRWRESDFSFDLIFDDVRCEVMFRALDRPDDVRKLLSLEVTFAYINESREIPRGVFDVLGTRIGRYPARKDLPPGERAWSGIFMDTNPCDTDHWLYTLFEEKRPEGHEVYHQPDALSEQAENLENLPEGYYTRLILGKSQDFIDVMVRGKYGFSRDGKPIFPEWNDRLHFDPGVLANPLWPIVFGQDFGLTPAAVLCQRDPRDGQLQVFDELVSEDMGASRFAAELHRKLVSEYPGRPVTGHGDPAGEQRAQTDEKTPFDFFLAAGLPIAPAPTNDFTLRREGVAGMLTRLTFMGRPGMVVGPKAPRCRKAMAGGYVYRRLNVSGTERFEDQPFKNLHSHVADALQYVAVGEGEDRRVLDGGKPRRVQLNFKVHRAMGSGGDRRRSA